jgi:hypothetical protein
MCCQTKRGLETLRGSCKEATEMSTTPFDAALAVQRAIVIQPELVQVGGDLIVGALLSRIVLWYEPETLGASKRHILRDGVHWIAKTADEWAAECCITRKQYLRAISVLKQKELVEVRVMQLQGVPTSHTRLIRENLQKQLDMCVT